MTDAQGRAVESDGTRPESDARASAMAVEDLADVTRADTFIAFAEPPADGALMPASAGRGGRHAEFGVALMLCDRVVLVGPREHVFHHHPKVVQFNDWAAAHGYLVCGDPVEIVP